MAETTIYSIGHSDHERDDLIALLTESGIDVVVDVRSQPYSRWVPQFNREPLARALEAAGLRYVWMGETLGGRPQDRSLYDGEDDRPNYDRMRRTAAYRAGIDALLLLAKRGTVAMMCSERDYRRCHRTLLITPTLLDHDIRVLHVLPDGRTVEAEKPPEQLSFL